MNDQLEKVARLSSEGDPVFFTCYDQIPEDFEVHPQVITLPCLGAVSPEFWAAALSITPNIQIYCNFSLCENCPTAGANARSLFIHAVNLGEQWSQVHMGSAKRLPEKADILSRFFDATSEEFQRRGVAKSLVGEVEDIATGKHRRQYSNTISDFYARKDHMRARGHATNLQYHAHIPSTAEQPIKKQWPRLCMIAKAVQENPEMAPRIPRYFAAIDYSACKKCYKPCFSHCPAGARAVGAEGIITVDPLLCIACGNCARYCPEEAAYLYETNASIFLPEASE
jgi:NAD-dependent dihydropyrimidine dehydrogenase PreA subunit